MRDFFEWSFSYIRDKSVDAYKNATVRSAVLRDEAAAFIPNASLALDWFRLADGPGGSTVGETAAGSATNPTANATTSTGADSHTSVSSSGTSQNSAGASAASATPSGSQPSPTGTTTSSRKHQAKDEKYLLQDLRLPNHPDRVQKLLKECRSLQINDHPGVCCVLLRVIVELSVSAPRALTLSGSQEAASLKNKITAMLKFLDPDIERPAKRDKELTQSYLEATELGVQYLHGFVHNPAVIPDQHLARRFSAAFRPMLERIDTAL